MTASIIAKAKGLKVNIDERLSERDAGEWEGMTRLEIEDGWPGYLAGHKRPNGFEPDESVAQRGIEALTEILANGGDGRILVVSHSGVVRAIERHLEVAAGQLSNLGGGVPPQCTRGTHNWGEVHAPRWCEGRDNHPKADLT